MSSPDYSFIKLLISCFLLVFQVLGRTQNIGVGISSETLGRNLGGEHVMSTKMGLSISLTLETMKDDVLIFVKSMFQSAGENR